MAERERQKCPACGHPRTSHTGNPYIGCIHNGACEYGCKKTYNDLTRKK